MFNLGLGIVNFRSSASKTGLSWGSYVNNPTQWTRNGMKGAGLGLAGDLISMSHDLARHADEKTSWSYLQSLCRYCEHSVRLQLH
jgi:hypothetical protein